MKYLSRREVDPPVDVLGIVAGHVLAMAGELDGEARQRRLVCPGQVAHHQPARLDMPVGHAAQHFGIEIAGQNAFGHGRELAG